MCYWIIPSLGIPIVQSTIQNVDWGQLSLETIQDELCLLDQHIRYKKGYPEADDKNESYHDYNIDNPDIPEALDHQTPMYEPFDKIHII